MRYGRRSLFARNVPFLLVAIPILLFFFTSSVNAFPGLYAPNCTPCHVATPTTCAGCHAHGVHSGAAKNNLNLTAQTDKASYAAGETVTVTLGGGYLGGWVRATLYDNTGTLADNSTGTLTGTIGPGGGPALPVTLTGTAPSTPGTYTFTAAWYGHQYDLSDVGGTTVFGPGWTPDAGNPDHGEERIATNSFTVAADNTAPTVLSTVPADSATNVPINTTVLATFDEPIDNTTVNDNSFFLSDGTDNVAGTISFGDNTVTFTPSAPLAASTAYTATLTTAVMDVGGNPLAANVLWSFTTGAGADTTAPAVLSTVPADNATNVATNTAVRATFNEAIDPVTVDNTSFFLSNGTDNVSGALSFTDNTITFTPTGALLDNTVYTARITTAVRDVAGNPLAADQVWSFTTRTTPPPDDDDDDFFGCAAVPSGKGSSGLLPVYGLLILLGLGSAIRRRMKRSEKR